MNVLVKTHTDGDAKGFRVALFAILDDHAVPYCALNLPDGDSLPTRFIELAIGADKQKKLPAIFQLLRRKGFPPVMYVPASVGRDQFHFAHSPGSRPEIRRVDIIYPQKSPLLFSLREELFARRQKRDGYWIADFDHRLAYEAAKSNRYLSEAKNVNVRIQTAIHERLRRLHNWIESPGVLITILGPDGAGKTTLANRLFEALDATFGPKKLLLWRPEVLPRLSQDSRSIELPHSKPPHGALSSMARFLAIFADYWAGHFVLVKPLLSRSALIIYDRDIHDILVDSRRYRYGGPMWLPRLLTKLLPRTESLFLVLDASLETILGRKQEVPVQEVQRQLEAYRSLASKLPNSYLIHSSDDVESTTSDAVRSVVDFLSRRYDRRHGHANSLRAKRERPEGVESWVRQ